MTAMVAHELAAFHSPLLLPAAATIADIELRSDTFGMSREEFLRNAKPHLIADVEMYPTDAGGRDRVALLAWGCPCVPCHAEEAVGWDGWPLLGDEPLMPGDRRRLGFYFFSGDEAAAVMRQAGRFYLWEGRYIGEAVVAD